MKKTLISAALVAAFGLTAIGNAAAADGKITFTGRITDASCVVTGGENTNGGVKDFTVALPHTPKSALPTAGVTAGETRFTVLLSNGTDGGKCVTEGGKLASLRFEAASSPMVNADTGRLKNQVGSAFATNVEVEVLNKAKAPINLYTNAGAPASGELPVDGAATLEYWARYYATGAATVGDVNTWVMYSIAYN